jgi:hypothetical protein
MKQITVLLAAWLVAVLRRTWLVAAITLVSCAALAARAASSLAAVERSAPPRARVAVSPRAARAVPDGSQLVARNMFCSQCGPAVAAATELALSGAVLIETSVGAEPRATIRVLATEAQGSWGLGDAVPGLGQVERIAPTWVAIVDPAGRRGRLSLLEGAGPGAATPGPAPASPWLDQVRQLDATTYEVDRALIRALVTGITKPGAARFLPILEHGQLAGLRLVGVTRDSLPAALGLQSRDTVTAIDGTPITNLQQGIDLFARLDQTASVELSGQRDGKPLVRTFRLK